MKNASFCIRTSVSGIIPKDLVENKSHRKNRIIILMAVTFWLSCVSSAEVLSQTIPGVVVSGQAYVCHGCCSGWEPLFFYTREIESDPGNWLYAAKLDDSSAQFGWKVPERGGRTVGASDSMLTTYVGSQAIAFDFDVYPYGGRNTVLSPLVKLELWSGDGLWKQNPEQLLWSTTGPWTTPAKHVQVFGTFDPWWYEFRLTVIPEPPTYAIVGLPLLWVYITRRRNTK